MIVLYIFGNARARAHCMLMNTQVSKAFDNKNNLFRSVDGGVIKFEVIDSINDTDKIRGMRFDIVIWDGSVSSDIKYAMAPYIATRLTV